MITKEFHVLIAEDDAFLTEIMQRALTEHGVRVSVAKDGQEAIDAMDATPPDLLLLDLLMPRVDGCAVLRHVREKGYSFPVIVLSNLSDGTQRAKCGNLSPDGYFVKSDMDDDALWSIVEKYFRTP